MREIPQVFTKAIFELLSCAETPIEQIYADFSLFPQKLFAANTNPAEIL
jgi:hypothetical protein